MRLTPDTMASAPYCPGLRRPCRQQPRARPDRPPNPALPLRGPPSAGGPLAGIPGDTKTYYAGAASGGVWKTTDGAQTWEPVFDSQPVQAIGAVAVAPSSPDTVWAGTGEAWAIRDADVMGDGIYKSGDAGKTWANVGLRETAHRRILVHPTNPTSSLPCARPNHRSAGGARRIPDNGRGKNWQRVLL
jgi:hypothetical protein